MRQERTPPGSAASPVTAPPLPFVSLHLPAVLLPPPPPPASSHSSLRILQSDLAFFPSSGSTPHNHPPPPRPRLLPFLRLPPPPPEPLAEGFRHVRSLPFAAAPQHPSARSAPERSARPRQHLPACTTASVQLMNTAAGMRRHHPSPCFLFFFLSFCLSIGGPFAGAQKRNALLGYRLR